MTKDEPAFPLFVFVRRRAIEMETGLALAGILIVDIPKRRMGHREEQMIQKITDGLYAMVRSGRMGDDAVINGWAGGVKPANAVDVRDDARMGRGQSGASRSPSGLMTATTAWWAWIATSRGKLVLRRIEPHQKPRSAFL
jgi:hypothetical protein